jgi:hypothetical protein
MAALYITEKQRDVVEQICEKMYVEYDKKRRAENPTKIYKYTAMCYVDHSLYCHFVDGMPDKVICGGENVGTFTTSRQSPKDEEHYVPEAERYKLFKQTHSTYCLKFVETGDGCFSFYQVEAMDKHGVNITTFEDPVNYDDF